VIVASEREGDRAVESVRLLNFAQADPRLRAGGRRPDGTARRQRGTGEVFRVLHACTQHLTPGDPPRELVQQAMATSILLDMRAIREGLRLLVRTGYLQHHGYVGQRVGRYTLSAVRHGQLVDLTPAADGAPRASAA
jgi:hypothetical protein